MISLKTAKFTASSLHSKQQLPKKKQFQQFSLYEVSFFCTVEMGEEPPKGSRCWQKMACDLGQRSVLPVFRMGSEVRR
uniref:Uncharacterized protein n=1 Tax=Anguilla anguilla TaxID=7936 RepID=A0A0E9RH48_ANGAN